MTAFALGTVIAVAILAFVLAPLVAWSRARRHAGLARRAHHDTPAETSAPTSAIDALREIEFDRATGKLSDTDYATLKATYTAQALAELRGAMGSPVMPPPAGA